MLAGWPAGCLAGWLAGAGAICSNRFFNAFAKDRDAMAASDDVSGRGQVPTEVVAVSLSECC